MISKPVDTAHTSYNELYDSYSGNTNTKKHIILCAIFCVYLFKSGFILIRWIFKEIFQFVDNL